MDNLEKNNSSASKIVESHQQNHYEYKCTNSTKDNENTSPIVVKRKRLENPYAQAECTENDLLYKVLSVEKEIVDQNDTSSGELPCRN